MATTVTTAAAAAEAASVPADKLPCQLRASDMPPELQHMSGSFKNARGQQLSYCALFPPASEIARLRGVVVWLHGIGEHSRRYFHLYSRLCAHGFGVLAYDLLAHGESDACDARGLRMHSSSFQFFVDDSNAFITFAERELLPPLLGRSTQDERPLPPMILGGMSYGTLVGLHTVLSGEHAFRAYFLVAPAVSVEMTPVLRVQAVFSKPLSAVLPRWRIVPGVNRDYVCRDPAFEADFEADPLTTTGPITTRMGEQSLVAMVAVQNDPRVEQPASIFCQLPLLFLMGSEDKVTSVPLARQFYERVANADKEFKLFDGFYHALFDDPEREQALAHLVEWLELRFPAPPSSE